MCSLEEAIHKTAKEFSEGTKGLAIRIGVRPGNLQNKVDPGMPDHVLNVNEALSMMLVAQDFRILEAMARETNHAVFPLPKTKYPADSDFISSWSAWQSSVAESAQTLVSAIADNKITPSEVKEIFGRFVQNFQAGMALVEVSKGMAEPEDKVTPIKRAK